MRWPSVAGATFCESSFGVFLSLGALRFGASAFGLGLDLDVFFALVGVALRFTPARFFCFVALPFSGLVSVWLITSTARTTGSDFLEIGLG